MTPVWSENDPEVRSLMKVLKGSAEDAILLLESTAEGLVMLFFPETEVEVEEHEVVPEHQSA
ncbi:MAG: hypothetical protein ACYC1K_00115 [Minisyncoccota bacterium]